MSLPTSEPIYNEPESSLPPARRRRQRRSLAGLNSDEKRAEILSILQEQVTPSFEFFLFTFICGIILIPALLIDSPALYLLAILIAPFLAPLVGISVAVVQGSGRFFLFSLGALVSGTLLIFGAGALAGWISRILPPFESTQAIMHAMFSLPDFLLLAIGTVISAWILSRGSEQKPLVSNVAVAYEIFLPVAVAGFGLTSGHPHLFPDGLLVFAVHLTWSVLIGSIVFALKGLRPTSPFGLILALCIAVISILALGMIFGLQVLPPRTAEPMATVLPVENLTQSPEPLATEMITGSTPIPNPTETKTTIVPATRTATLAPTPTFTETVTPIPTPVWARVYAKDSNGAIVRSTPGGAYLTSLLNGSAVKVMPDVVEKDRVFWVKVIMEDGREGWMVQALLETATPAPGW